MKYAEDVTGLIGNTPLLKLKSISEETKTLTLGKCEFMNPSSSVKDRIGFNLINQAILSGKVNKETVIIEPTSGNTGIALAGVCASKGLKLILTMPSSMSLERRKLLKALGAELVLTPAELGMKGAVAKAEELALSMSNSFVPQQFSNQANPEIHRKTTAMEIYNDTDGKIDIFIAAVGTGGTITGVGEVLKNLIPNLQIIAVEPKESPVLSGGKPGPHKIQGIGAGFIPGILNQQLYDEILQVDAMSAIQKSRELAKNEGVLVGVSAGANIHAASIVASRSENIGKTIVTILCDTGERYLSTDLYEFEE